MPHMGARGRGRGSSFLLSRDFGYHARGSHFVYVRKRKKVAVPVLSPKCKCQCTFEDSMSTACHNRHHSPAQILPLCLCLVALACLLPSIATLDERSLQEDVVDFQDYEFGDYDYYVPYTEFSEYDTETPEVTATADTTADKKAAATSESDSDAKAEEKPAGKKSKRNKKGKFTNKVVDFVPAVNISFGDDIDDEGKCADEIERYCEDVEEGEDKPDISDDCREEVYQFKISRNANINRNIRLAKQCKEDADKFCNVTWFFGYKQGQVLSCLRDVKEKVKKKCKNQIFKTMMDACKDDAASLCKDVKNGGGRVQGCLARAGQRRPGQRRAGQCKDDAASLCEDVKSGGGRVQGCLRDKRMQISWPCEEQLYRQEIENAGDIRLSVRLYGNCMADKRKFCKDMKPGIDRFCKDMKPGIDRFCKDIKPGIDRFCKDIKPGIDRDIEPGNARVKDCLEDNRESLSAACRPEIDAMIERRVHDFRLDSKLRAVCESDILNLCAYFGDVDDMDMFDSSVINCLQDYTPEIKDKQCKQQVIKYVKHAGEDIRFNVPLAEACYDDRQKYCADIAPEIFVFNVPLAEPCFEDRQKYCADIAPVKSGCAEACFEDRQKYYADIAPVSSGGGEGGCGVVVRKYVKHAEEDVRFNVPLAEAYFEDRQKYCTDFAPYVKHAEEDVRFNVPLAEAYFEDRQKYCADFAPGSARVIRCLSNKRQNLSPICRATLFDEEVRFSENIDFQFPMKAACTSEMERFCKGIPHGNARIIRCLQENR
eukprot:gene16764-23039_t